MGSPLFVVRCSSFATRRSLLAIRRSPSADRGGTGVSSPVQQEQRSCPSIKEKFAPVFWSFGAHMGVRTIRESRTPKSERRIALLPAPPLLASFGFTLDSFFRGRRLLGVLQAFFERGHQIDQIGRAHV